MMDQTSAHTLNSIVISTLNISRSIDDVLDTIRDATLVVISTEIISRISNNQSPDITDLISFQTFSQIIAQLCILTSLQLNAINLDQDDSQFQYISNLKSKLDELLQKKENLIFH